MKKKVNNYYLSVWIPECIGKKIDSLSKKTGYNKSIIVRYLLLRAIDSNLSENNPDK